MLLVVSAGGAGLAGDGAGFLKINRSSSICFDDLGGAMLMLGGIVEMDKALWSSNKVDVGDDEIGSIATVLVASNKHHTNTTET